MAASQPLEVLRQAWAQVLGEDESAIKDDDVFFDLGGDSLKAAELIDNAEERGLIFTIRDLFMNPSLESLASCISSDSSVGTEYDDDDSENYEASTQESEEAPPSPLEAPRIPKSFPLGPRQPQLVDHPSTSRLKRSLIWRRAKLSVDVPVIRIRQACDSVVLAHPACRARYNDEDKCFGIIDEHQTDIDSLYRFRTRLYGNLTPPQIAELEKDALDSLDIVKGPVLSLDLYRSEDCICLFLVAHSILIDDASCTIILRDIDMALSERVMPVPPKHGVWELFQNTPAAARDTIGATKDGIEIPDGERRWKLPSGHHTLDTSIRSIMEISNHSAGSDPKRAQDTATKAALCHILETFNNVISPSVVHISFESSRRPGWERVVGNLEEAPLVPKIGQPGWDCPESLFDNIQQQVGHGLQPTIPNWTHRELAFTEEHDSTADLFIRIFQRPEQFETMPSNFRAIAKVERDLDWDLSNEYPQTYRGFVELDLLVSAGGRLETTCRFYSRSRHAVALREWATKLWENVTEETLEATLAERLHHSEYAPAVISSRVNDHVKERGTRDRDTLSYVSLHGREVPQKTLQALSTRYNLNVCDIESVYPCSPIQTSLIVDIDGRANQYMKQLVFRLADDVHLEHFKAAWDETVRANPVLRTRICRLENTLGNVQVVVRDGLTWHTAHAKPLTQFLEADANTALGVDGGPAFRYAIVASADHDGDIRRYFIWTVHHALCDGASIEMILAEAAARFRGKPVLPRQPFESFIRSAALTPDPAQERVFWRETLSRTSPTPYPRVRQSSAFRADPSSRLSQTLTLDGHPPGGVTRALLLRATWAVLMAHYNGTEEVCFGVINSGRTAAVPGVSTMSGPTVNLVPITLHIDGQETVASFLSRVRTQAAEMIPFEHSGIANIRKYVADSPATALDFQTLMVVHPATFSKAIAPALDDLGLQYLGDMGKSEQHPYPLIISLTLASNTVDLSLQYDSQVIETQQAQRVIFHFQTVLDQLSKASEDALMRSITLLSDNDIAQIAEWNRYTPPAENTCVDWLFQAQVAKQPNATAVCSLEKSLTYHEVDEKSSSLALQLVRDQGVHPGDFVAVCFGKSIWTVVAILAVFKAGGTYVPIDPAHPMGRIREIVDTACIKVALASQDGASVLNTICPRIIIVGPSLRSCPTEGFHSRSNPQNLAYLLFTSGSTGKPKGILISHSAICTSIKYHGKAFGAGPHWRTFQFCAHTFDISIGEFLTTLAYGGCICVPTDHDRLNNLAGSITALNANTLLVVPTVAKLLHPSDVPTLKTLVLGGEPVTSEIITRWADHVELTCSYGPSETAVWSAANLRVTTAANPAHIGGNIGGTMWIVNLENYHELCAIGCVGELVVSGSILGNGYFNDPATTDAAFVAAPRWLRDISPSYTSGDRIYKTGDLARYNPDGTFHIVGRRDTQVKLRGFRIELGEIENQCIASGAVTAALADLPDSGPCKGQIVVVVSLANPELGVQDGEGGFVLANGRFSNMEQLKAHLRYVLPEYMVPTVLVVLNRFPHLISGKVDRKAVKNWIRAMDIDTYTGLVQGTTDNATDAGDIVPGSLADRLRVLWSGVLHTPAERIGKRTSFFSLGGDSLAAIEVVSRAKAIGLPVTVRGIISANTLGNLVAILENSDATATVANTTKAPRQQWIYDLSEPDKRNLQMRIKGKSSGTVKDAYPLAPIQRDMSNAREVEPTVFVLSWKMHILPLDSQPVSLDKLAVAWKRVVSRYPILRTVFLPPSGTIPALQVVLEDIVPEVIVISVSAHDPEPSFHLVGAQDIDHGPLPHRALFYRHGDKYHGVIELDHRIIDGWSLGLIRAAFLEAYNDANIICLNEAPPPYKNFVAALHPSRVEADKRHWSAVLRGAQPSILAPLPHKITPSHSQGSQLLPDGKTVLHLPDLKSQALLAFCANNGTTVASVVDAAWAQTLSVYTHSQEVCFAYIDSGRDEDSIPGVSSVVGPLINILVHRLPSVSTEDSPATLAALAQRIQHQRGEATVHVACSIREVLEGDLGLKQQRPLFNTGVNFQRRPVSHETGRLAMVDDLEESRDPWHFDVLVRVTHTADNDSLKAALEFNGWQFSRGQMEDVLADFWTRIQNVTSKI